VVRPRVPRRIGGCPKVRYYKPAGVPLVNLQEVILLADEFEALRLCDYLGVSQVEAAGKMGISQPTIARVLSIARKKVVEAIAEGMAIRILEK